MFEIGDITIFHSGDTAYFRKFREYGQKWDVDIALLDFAKVSFLNHKGRQVKIFMEAEEAARAARDFNCNMAIPTHWDLFEERQEDPKKFKMTVSRNYPSIKVIILKVGQKLEYPVV